MTGHCTGKGSDEKMLGFGKMVVKHKKLILLLALILLIPATLGYVNTKVNYDILSYLPEDIETMVGQDVLVDQFGTGAFSLMIVDDMKPKDVVELKSKIEQVEHVSHVIWYDSFADLTIPMEMLPDELYDTFNKDNSTMMAIIYDQTTSADGTMEAIDRIREITNKQCFLSGMSAVVTDTKELSEKETPVYVLIAVALAVVVLGLTMDSFLAPVLFLLSIGMAILYNMGTNFFLGQISYITKALAAVLQLGVTLDYSIFLWHSYEEQKGIHPDHKEEAMAQAIANTISSVVGSSITTIAGFIALCFMSFTLGMDLGIVMSKGVIFGVISCVTVLPSMLLVFDKAVEKTGHKALIPDLPKVSEWIVNHYIVFGILFILLWIPAIIGYKNTKVYYNLDSTLPQDLPSIVANAKLNESFQMNSTHMVLVPKDMEMASLNQLIYEMKQVDGVKDVLGTDALIGPNFPREMLPEEIIDKLESDEWKMMLVMSEYKVASDEVNEQCDQLETVIKKYDTRSMLVGEAPCTRDLIHITAKDFKNVSLVSIGAILLIVLLVFRVAAMPVILVGVIELAIFINMGIPYYTDSVIPFIASVVIGTIQLGSTVDYAILMTSRYMTERKNGLEKKEAVLIAHKTSMKSIFVSALSFFAATFGVGLVSNIDMIGSLCNLMARGALISMAVVLTMLPMMYMMFDGLLCRSLNKKRKAQPASMAHQF